MQFTTKYYKLIRYSRYMSTASDFTRTSESTASSIIKYFFRKGNKISTETARRNMFKEYAQKKGKATQDNFQPKRSSLFKSFFISATPFIGLKTIDKRRGKVTKHKVVTLGSSTIGRKSFLEFSAIVCTSGRSTKPFINRFFNELNTLYAYSQKRSSGGVMPVSTFYEKRALLYQTAHSAFLPSITNEIKS